MGILISRFRKKKSTVDVLDDIEKKITELQKFRYQDQQRQKKYIGHLLLYSIIIYVISALIFYFFYFPRTWKYRAIYSTPLLLFPFIVFLVKKFLHWYFVKRIAKNDQKLADLREKKKEIIEDVEEHETYKKAREILEKYDPARFKKNEKPPSPSPKSPATPTGHVLRQRTPASRGIGRGTPMMRSTPRLPHSAMSGGQPRQLMSAQRNGQAMHSPYARPPGPPLPRPVPARQRGKVDRLVEYLVGEGPQNRYALICRQCHSHNGMALKEEFEYISFRCCYCFVFNPARKQRPFAPKLDFASPAVVAVQQPSLTSNINIKSGGQHRAVESKDEQNNVDDDEDDNDMNVEENEAETIEDVHSMNINSTSNHDPETTKDSASARDPETSEDSASTRDSGSETQALGAEGQTLGADGPSLVVKGQSLELEGQTLEAEGQVTLGSECETLEIDDEALYPDIQDASSATMCSASKPQELTEIESLGSIPYMDQEPVLSSSGADNLHDSDTKHAMFVSDKADDHVIDKSENESFSEVFNSLSVKNNNME